MRVIIKCHNLKLWLFNFMGFRNCSRLLLTNENNFPTVISAVCFIPINTSYYESYTWNYLETCSLGLRGLRGIKTEAK